MQLVETQHLERYTSPKADTREISTPNSFSTPNRRHSVRLPSPTRILDGCCNTSALACVTACMAFKCANLISLSVWCWQRLMRVCSHSLRLTYSLHPCEHTFTDEVQIPAMKMNISPKGSFRRTVSFTNTGCISPHLRHCIVKNKKLYARRALTSCPGIKDSHTYAYFCCFTF